MHDFLIYEGLEHVLEQIIEKYEDYIQSEERTNIRDYLIKKAGFSVMISDGRENAYLMDNFKLKGICICKGQCKLIVESDDAERKVEISGQIAMGIDIERILEILESDFKENRL